MSPRRLIGRFSKDVFKWFQKDLITISDRIGNETLARITSRLERETHKYKGDLIRVAVIKESIFEEESKKAARQALDSYIAFTEKLLTSLKERQELDGEENSHTVRTSPLREVRRISA